MKKNVRILSTFLGISMFSFGTLKFIDPFKMWYRVQISMSDFPLPTLSYSAGQIGEIVTGVLLLLLIISRDKISPSTLKSGVILMNLSIIVMMIVATYIHLHPGVSNDVLPLKIKPPIIPLFFLVLSVFNLISPRKQLNQSHS